MQRALDPDELDDLQRLWMRRLLLQAYVQVH